VIYLIGSLRNPEIPKLAKVLRDQGLEVFADWYAAGELADDAWRDYERGQGFSFREALARPAARNVFDFDKRHIDASSVVVLVLPAGKSGHLELGYALGRGKKGYILLDNPDRWDVMYQFATAVFDKEEELVAALKPSTDILYQERPTNPRLHPSIPTLGISCACADCVRDRGNLRGSGALK